MKFTPLDSVHTELSIRAKNSIFMIAVCVVAFLFPSGRSSGQKKTKTKPVTPTESGHSGEIFHNIMYTPTLPYLHDNNFP